MCEEKIEENCYAEFKRLAVMKSSFSCCES